MPNSFSKASSDGIFLPLTSMYSGQLEKNTFFSLSEMSVLCAALRVLDAALGAAGGEQPRQPEPRPPTAAPRTKPRRVTSGRTIPLGVAPGRVSRGRRVRDIWLLQESLELDARILTRHPRLRQAIPWRRYEKSTDSLEKHPGIL